MFNRDQIPTWLCCWGPEHVGGNLEWAGKRKDRLSSPVGQRASTHPHSARHWLSDAQIQL
ncbi:hypothetical protein I79_003571 [Cricetulus griseus]|uniref:Uncharacterized protein n=1 Tax=Cricetulus griseus TaxID=10029 RepID=G3H0B7_CRIGR|nr:hypothetical protein I79_003571 [Cricetulus griseus]